MALCLAAVAALFLVSGSPLSSETVHAAHTAHETWKMIEGLPPMSTYLNYTIANFLVAHKKSNRLAWVSSQVDQCSFDHQMMQYHDSMVHVAFTV